MTEQIQSNKTFSSPFSRDYWKSAVVELKKPRMLAVAAMIVALRVLLKAVSIKVFPGVYITFGFFANALGSMIYGPVLGLIGGAISDTIGAFLFPTGDYFFPFILTEMLSSFIFALFLYRSKPTALRVLLSRFSVIVICNLLLTPVIMRWYYAYFGIESSYALFTTARLIKNTVLFPAESILLIIFLRAITPATNRLKLTFTGERKLAVTWKTALILLAMLIVAAVVIVLYYVFYVSK
ncbi:MAG: folate family ECF transporter S component [Clostridia bacterium]|nr:folate family ECF transporter S component [Clostridia bacterium]